jgi:hypothetical protein
MRYLVLSILSLSTILGCANRQELRVKYDYLNERAEGAAFERAMKEHRLTPVTPLSETGADDAIGGTAQSPEGGQPEEPHAEWRTLPGGGTLRSRGPGKPLEFSHSSCMGGDSCGCTLRIVFRFGTRPDGNLVILRSKAEVHVDKVTTWKCEPSRCGTPPGELPEAPFKLPYHDPSRVTVIDVPYERWVVGDRCVVDSDPTP